MSEHSLRGATLPAPASKRASGAAVPLAGLFALGWGSNQFAPLLLFYPQIAAIGAVEIQGVFVSYVAALLPMLLLGGWLSDRIGRSRVLVAALAVSMLSSTALLVGGTEPWMILIARVLSGVSAGIGFSSGTAWATELLPAPRGSRLSMVFMTAGMGAGPLVIGALSYALLRLGAPVPQVWVMVPHLLITIAVLIPMLRNRSPMLERNVAAGTGMAPIGVLPLSIPADRVGLRDRRFSRVVLPLAPWTLVCTGLPLATLPSAIDEGAAVNPLLFSAFLTPLPALGGISVQPLAERAEIRAERLAPIALLVACVALGVSFFAVERQSLVLMLIACLVFGFAHGFCQTVGLRLIASISPSTQLGRNTAIFQALSYLGFLAPLPVALLAEYFPLPTILLAILGLALASFIVLFLATRRPGGFRRAPRPPEATN